jgi:hypothetical protein
LGLLAAISRCPVASEATENQRSPLVEAGAACLVQETPASADVQMGKARLIEMRSAPANPLSIKIRPLGQAHSLGHFDCGVEDLDEFLRNDALRYAERRIARVYVAIVDAPADTDDHIVGYVALVADSLVLETGEKRKLNLKHRDPKYVPAIKVGRLATCTSHKSRGVAVKLLRSRSMSRTSPLATWDVDC